MNNYEQGFISKCAEYGIDPNELIKRAGRGEFTGKLITRALDSSFWPQAQAAQSQLRPLLRDLQKHDIGSLASASDRLKHGNRGIRTEGYPLFQGTGSTNDNIIKIIKNLKNKLGPRSSFERTMEGGNRTVTNILQPKG